MKAYFDTSVLVAALLRDHPRHAESAAWLDRVHRRAEHGEPLGDVAGIERAAEEGLEPAQGNVHTSHPTVIPGAARDLEGSRGARSTNGRPRSCAFPYPQHLP